MSDVSVASITKVFTAEAVTASSTATSEAVNLKKAAGYFSVQAEITGDGTATISYLISNNGTDWLEPETGTVAIMAALTKTSGGGSDGKVIESFSVPYCHSIKLKITETGTANTVTVTAWLVS